MTDTLEPPVVLQFGVKPPNSKIEREYISGGALSTAISPATALPRMPDSVELLAGHDVYSRMLADSCVVKSIWTAIYAVVSDGIEFSPAVAQPAQTLDPTPEQKQHAKDYEEAKSYSDFCTRVFDSLLETPSRSAFEQLLFTAMVYRHSLAELVWEEQKFGMDKGKIILAKIKPKPRHATALVVDQFYNVIGCVYANPSTGSVVSTGAVVNPKNILPRYKIFVLPFRRQEGDPAGTSILTAAYNPWNVKSVLWPILLKYLTRFGVPSLKGFVAPGEGDQPVIKRNEDGTTEFITNEDGTQKYEPATDAMGRALVDFQAGTVFVGKNGATVETLEPSVTSQDLFGNSFRMLNEEIISAILLQTLANSEGIHSTRAQSETHMRVLDVLVFALRQLISEVVASDIIRYLIEWNFGKDALRFVPKVSLGDTERRDFAGDITAISAGVTSGFIDPSQFAELDVTTGLPRRDLAAMQERAKIKLETAQAIADVHRKRAGLDQPPGPAGPPPSTLPTPATKAEIP